MQQQTALTTLKAVPGEFKDYAGQLVEIVKEDAALVFDYESSKGEKEARSHVAQLRKSKTAVTAIHKDAKADLLERTRKLDGGKRTLMGVIDGMIETHMKPLNEKAERKAAEKRRQAEIEAAKAREEQERIDAERAKLEAEQAKFRQEQEEAERKRQAQIRADNDAAERVAQEKADRIAADKRAADAERATQEANARAEAAELKQKEMEQQQAAQEPAPQVDEQAEARNQNTEYRRKINQAIVETIMLAEVTEHQAKQITTMLVKGFIPNVTVNY